MKNKISMLMVLAASVAASMITAKVVGTAAEPVYNKPMPPMIYSAEVYNVVDGDTVDVRFKIFEGIILDKRIRLIGIDAPEVRGEERPQGLKSTEWLKNELNDDVYLQTDGSLDKYGRMLGSLLKENDENIININKLMIEEGFAEEYQ